MSGGAYDYFFFKVDSFIEELEERNASNETKEQTKKRSAFINHLKHISEACRAIEWVDSGDFCDGDEIKYIDKCLKNKL